jgi:hypothetical protein
MYCICKYMDEAPVGDSNAGNALMSRRTQQRIWLMFKQRLVFFSLCIIAHYIKLRCCGKCV